MMKAFVRWSEKPEFYQDERTFILAGRWQHLLNTSDGQWIVCRHRLSNPLVLNRMCTRMERIGIWAFLRETGLRGLLEVVEDFLSVRFLSRLIDKRQARKRERDGEANYMAYGTRPLEPPSIEGIGGTVGEFLSDGRGEENPHSS